MSNMSYPILSLNLKFPTRNRSKSFEIETADLPSFRLCRYCDTPYNIFKLKLSLVFQKLRNLYKVANIHRTKFLDEKVPKPAIFAEQMFAFLKMSG